MSGTSAAVTVSRVGNANLSSLVLSAGTLSPAFTSATTGYTATVASQTMSVTITPTTAAPSSTITVNGTVVVSGATSGSIALNPGANPITTVVTAQDGITTKTYTVTVFRPYLVGVTGNSGAGSLRQALLDAAGNSGADVITFAPALSGQTITLDYAGGAVTPGTTTAVYTVAVPEPASLAVALSAGLFLRRRR